MCTKLSHSQQMIHTHQENTFSKQQKQWNDAENMFKSTNEGIRTTSSKIFWVSNSKFYNADFVNVFVQIRCSGCLIWKFFMLNLIMHLPAADYFYYLFVGKNSFILKKTGIYRRLDNINVKKKSGKEIKN